MTPDPPWSIQSEAVGSWQAKATSADLSKRCQACLQLAISYYLGYGVRPSTDLTLSYLTIGLEGNDTIMMLYHRLIAALAVDVKQPNINKTFMTDLDSQLRCHTARETYFATRVYQHQQLRVEETRSARHDAIYKRHRDLALVELVKKHDLNLLSNNLSSKKHDDIAVSRALLEASRCGNARMVQLLCVHCDMFVHDESLLTPVHWLIMFEESDAAAVANALIHGTSTDKIGPCRGNINSMSSNESGSLFIAEHCLELFGTPLHWAVRTRNLKLVELLTTLGADINVRTEVPSAFVTNIHRPQLPSLSPLDIAVMFHLPEIVIRLLDLGAIREGGGGVYTKSHSSFLCIGLRCTPFSRYIIHGKHYRDALKETIQVLVRKGYNINDTNADGNDPLKVALSNADCESYIIEELLNAGALPSQRTLETQENAVDVAISHAPYRRYSVENLRLVLPYVRSVSDSNSSTYNATHRAAIGGSELMVEVLSTAEGFDINAKTSVRNGGRYGGDTALHLAALSESVEVITMLVRKGANMEIPDSSQYTPLQVATFHRKTKAADTFIALGANVFLTPLRRDTVLHVAVAGVTSGYSLVKHLLTKHPRLRKRSLLNATDHIGWTALHKAAYFGDFEAVEALLDEGADRTLMDKSRGPMPGRTPLERVEHEIWRLSIDAWDSDLKRIMAGGLQAKDHHVANLHEIALMLKDGSLS